MPYFRPKVQIVEAIMAKEPITVETEEGPVTVPKGHWAVWSNKGFYGSYENAWFTRLFEVVAYANDTEKIH